MRRFLPLLFPPLLACSATATVKIAEDERAYEISNGILTARLDKRSGNVTALRRGETELLGSGGSGYWSCVGSSDQGRVSGFPAVTGHSVSIDPAETDGALGEIRFLAPFREDSGRLPVNAAFHYTLLDGSDSLHIYAVLDHPAGLPGFSVGEARYVMKLDPAVFDHLTIDPDRSREMPTGDDWDRGEELNMKEVRRLTTGIHAGHAEHKYSYSALFSESPAYGWSSSRKALGLWMINPSLEYIAGGPAKAELTAHLDVNPRGLPVLLNMWHGSHYGGTSLTVAREESWSKVIGPFLIHTNTGRGGSLALWRQAMETAEAEAAKWPYPWVREPLYHTARTGGLRGKILIHDPHGHGRRGEMWVGLTAPDYRTPRRGRETIGWQRDSKHYQYWTRAAADGSFELPAVRPGTYVLRAYADGILGEFAAAGTAIDSTVRDLGPVTWTPDRAGPTVWEIGIPDRSAREFRNGDRYWEWGNHLRFRDDFPGGVDFTIGKSDPRQDWNLFQPLQLDSRGRVTGDSTWRVRFTLDGEPPARPHLLRIALCGHRQNSRLTLTMNGHPIGDTGRLHENGVMHREGHRGLLTGKTFPVPAATLLPGENTLQLRLSGNSWHQAILYDYLRLERLEP